MLREKGESVTKLSPDDIVELIAEDLGQKTETYDNKSEPQH